MSVSKQNIQKKTQTKKQKTKKTKINAKNKKIKKGCVGIHCAGYLQGYGWFEQCYIQNLKYMFLFYFVLSLACLFQHGKFFQHTIKKKSGKSVKKKKIKKKAKKNK